MTPEEEERLRQQQAQQGIITLNNNSNTVVDPRNTVTQHGDKVTTTEKDPTVTTERKQAWMTNPDGTPNQPLIDYYNQRTAENQRLYHIDPNTNQVDKDSLFGALGIRPQDTQQLREQEMQRNRNKQKASALFQSAALISDMISAAHGGNAWKRDKDNSAEQAQAANDALRREQLAEDANNARIVQNNYDAFNKAQEALRKQMNEYNFLVRTQSGGNTKQTTTQGNTVTTTTGGNRHTTGTQQQQLRGNGSGSGSGKSSWGNNSTMQIGLMNNGKVQYRDITGQQAKNIIEHAEKIYEDALTNGDEATQKAIMDLLGSKIVKIDKDGNFKWDDEALLRSGYIFEADKVFRKGILQGVDESIRDYYRRITGDQTNYDELPDWDVVTPAARAIEAARQQKPSIQSNASGSSKQWKGVQQTEYDDD